MGGDVDSRVDIGPPPKRCKPSSEQPELAAHGPRMESDRWIEDEPLASEPRAAGRRERSSAIEGGVVIDGCQCNTSGRVAPP